MNVTSVKRIHQSDWTDSGVRFLRARDIVSAAKNEEPDDYLYISKEKYEKYSAISGKVAIDDMLVTGVGTIGIPYLVRNLEPLYFKDGNIIWFQNNKKIDGEFFYYSFWGSKIQNFINESAGTGTVGTYTIESGKKTPILLPAKEEQQVLGKYFRNLDHLITLHQRKLGKIKYLKKAFLNLIFSQKLRFRGFTESWELRKLGDMGETFTGLSGKTKEDFGHGDAEFVTYMNVFTNPIAASNGTENVEIDGCQSLVQYGDVLFTTSSETPEEVGMSSIWLENRANVYLNSFCFGYRLAVNFDPHYIAFMLRSAPIRKKFIFLAQGISRYNISKNKVMEMTVPMPKLNEQKIIGVFFTHLDNLITLHQKKIDSLKEMKKILLKNMLI